MKKFNFKKIIFILTFIFLLFLLIFLCDFVYNTFLNKIFLENSIKSVDDIFTINKITLFSSCFANSNINSNNTTTINNLSQYTDIAIFINTVSKDFTLENTLKSVSIDGISLNTFPILGTPNLYYKGLNSFATPNLLEENLIDSSLDFSISSEDEIDFSKPILFNNCANPITLSFLNSNIKSNYTLTNVSSIAYDGSLLKNCNVLLNDLKCNLSFTISLENNLGQIFKCPVYIDIPLGDDTSSIYDGSYTYSYNPNYSFYLCK